MGQEITIKSYYQNKDFNFLCDELKNIDNEIRNSNNEKISRKLSAKLYSFYIQLIEIFLINTYAIIENNLWGNIFISNNQLRTCSRSFIIFWLKMDI